MNDNIKYIARGIPYVKQTYLAIKQRYNSAKLRNNATPIFIYQMGKVASSSVTKSIKKQYKGACIQGHHLYKDHKHYDIRAIYKYNIEEKKPIKIISLVREPISRNVSAFFENFHRDTGYRFKKNPYSSKELVNVFLEKFYHNTPIEWFDKHIKSNFGIDVYSKPFPEDGYDFFKNGNVELLLMKHNLDDKVKEKIISDYIGVEDFELQNANVGSKKIYSDTYNNFKSSYLPENYLDRMLDSKYSKHFYLNDIEKIKNKWRNNS